MASLLPPELPWTARNATIAEVYGRGEDVLSAAIVMASKLRRRPAPAGTRSPSAKSADAGQAPAYRGEMTGAILPDRDDMLCIGRPKDVARLEVRQRVDEAEGALKF
jgi:hypothetical protein